MTYEEKARFQMRKAVLIDKTLSPSARCVYFLLDDMAAFSGQAWPSNEYVASQLGFSERSVKRFLDELRAGGYLQTERRANKSSVQALAWQSERKAPNLALASKAKANGDTPKGQPWPLHSLLENQGIEPRSDPDGSKTNCTACLDLGFRSGDAYSGELCDCSEGENLRRWRESPEFAFLAKTAGRSA